MSDLAFSSQPAAAARRIDLTRPRYDQSSYWGRLLHFMDVTDPRTLFVSSRRLAEAKQLMDDYRAGRAVRASEDELWKAKKIVDSTLHPDTGKPIFLPWRMSSFVPTNMLILFGMLLPNPSIKSIIFWQWANQSVNVAINFANANKTTEMSLKETGIAYAAAVTTSCGLAVGLNQAVPRLRKISPTVRGVLTRLVPFVAVAAAGTVNVYLMRWKELRDGIDVLDAQGQSLGRSQKAGSSAVGQVAISRVLTSMPALLIPPLIMGQLERTRFIRNRPYLATPINFGVIGLTLMTALPMAIAVFPQRATVPVTSLEERFHHLKDSLGRPVTTVTYNKGL
ncbi:uncharacterized protein VTP21DRAFT_476 [Calcarisporiella thermophila]|uniref:uncharacterized protein n=1 Tax=Calcarisporiella thermophila TaxID=911321 RepID=UPI00374286E7